MPLLLDLVGGEGLISALELSLLADADGLTIGEPFTMPQSGLAAAQIP